MLDHTVYEVEAAIQTLIRDAVEAPDMADAELPRIVEAHARLGDLIGWIRERSRRVA